MRSASPACRTACISGSVARASPVAPSCCWARSIHAAAAVGEERHDAVGQAAVAQKPHLQRVVAEVGHRQLRRGTAGGVASGQASKAAVGTACILAGVARQHGLEQVHEAGERLPLDRLVETYGLSADESAILQLALMPLFDVSFRTRIARYNNNILFDFVDADLALSLLYANRPERLNARAMLTTEAPLFAHRLLVPVAAKDPKGHGLIAHELRPRLPRARLHVRRPHPDHAVRRRRRERGPDRVPVQVEHRPGVRQRRAQHRRRVFV